VPHCTAPTRSEGVVIVEIIDDPWARTPLSEAVAPSAGSRNVRIRLALIESSTVRCLEHLP
jgi:hypothetical protein